MGKKEYSINEAINSVDPKNLKKELDDLMSSIDKVSLKAKKTHMDLTSMMEIFVENGLKNIKLFEEQVEGMGKIVSTLAESRHIEQEAFMRQAEERSKALIKEKVEAEKELETLQKKKEKLEKGLDKAKDDEKKTKLREELAELTEREQDLQEKLTSFDERREIQAKEIQTIELHALTNKIVMWEAAGMSRLDIEKLTKKELTRIEKNYNEDKKSAIKGLAEFEKTADAESAKKAKEALAEKLKEMDTYAAEAKRILTSIFKTADDFIKQKIDVRKKQIESITEKIKQVDEEIKLTAKQTQDQLDHDKEKYLKEYNYEPKEGEELETEESIKAELAELEKLYKLKQEIEAFEKKKNNDKVEQKVVEKEQQEAEKSEKEQIEEAAAAKDEGAKERSVELTAEQAERLSTLSNKHGEVAAALQSQTDAEKAANTEKEQLEKEKKKLEEKNARDERKQQKLKMAQSMLEGGMNVALSITKALAMGPGIGKVLAIIASAAGAVQLAFMSLQMAKMKNLKAEDGGLLFGKRHASGGMRIEGTNIEVEGGEYVVNRESTKKNLGLVRYINSQRKELQPNDINAYFGGQGRGYETAFRQQFRAGGELPPLQNNASIDSDAMIEAIRDMKFEPKVAVTDIKEHKKK